LERDRKKPARKPNEQTRRSKECQEGERVRGKAVQDTVQNETGSARKKKSGKGEEKGTGKEEMYGSLKGIDAMKRN